MNSICKKRVRLLDGFVYGLIYFCAALSVFLIAGIVLYVIAKGFDKVNWEFLTTTTSVLKGTVGIAGNILNTIYIIILILFFDIISGQLG